MNDASAGGRDMAEQPVFHTPAWVRPPLMLEIEQAAQQVQRPHDPLPTSQSLAHRRATLPRQVTPTYDDAVEHVPLPPEVVASILAPRVPAGYVPKAPALESEPVRTEGRWLQQPGFFARLLGARPLRVTLAGTVLTVVEKGRHRSFDLSDPLQVGEYGGDTADPDWTLELRSADSAEPLVLDRDQIDPHAIVPVLDHHQAVAWARMEDSIGRYGR